MVVVIEDITDQEPAAPEAPPKDDESERAEDSKDLETKDLGVEDASNDQEQDALERAEQLKQDGNSLFRNGSTEKALEKYTEALELAPSTAKEKAIYHSNRAACLLKLNRHAEAVTDCTQALEQDPSYCKALMRRAAAYESLDDLEHALLDLQQALKLEPDSKAIAAGIARLQPIVEERREKLKEEMLGKLKELGNTVLNKFGMSLDNFKAEKDPNTGSYSIKFQQ